MRYFRTVPALTLMFGAALLAQRTPQTKNEVARPGGKLPNSPKLALVKIADGFNDPTNVASPKDGSGRLFVIPGGLPGTVH